MASKRIRHIVTGIGPMEMRIMRILGYATGCFRYYIFEETIHLLLEGDNLLNILCIRQL